MLQKVVQVPRHLRNFPLRPLGLFIRKIRIMVEPNLPAVAGFEHAAKTAAEFIRSAKSDATRRAYACDWHDFERWCQEHSRPPLPAEPLTVAAYLSSLAAPKAGTALKASTIRRRCAAIAHVHRTSGHGNPVDHPGVTSTMQGINRALGTAPQAKAALTVDILQKAIRKIPEDLEGLRDRALILVCFAAALRRSELVALDHSDIKRHPKGILLQVRRSKTDQTGAGFQKAIPYGRRLNVIGALDHWLEAAKITEGPIFRGVIGRRVLPDRIHPHQVWRIVRRRVQAIGLDPKEFGAHSLRRGYLTTAADHGASLVNMAKHAGHSKIETTAGYIEVADAFKNHSGSRFL